MLYATEFVLLCYSNLGKLIYQESVLAHLRTDYDRNAGEEIIVPVADGGSFPQEMLCARGLGV